MMKKKVLFLSAYNSSFVRNDRSILQSFTEVTDIIIPQTRNLFAIIVLALKILKGVVRNDLTFCWFAELPAYFAVLFSKMLKKKCIVVVGGYEVANVPEVNYGGMLSFKNVKKVRYILKNADLTLAVSKSNLEEIKNNFITKKLELIYNGVGTDQYFPAKVKKTSVITVGNVTAENLKRKGLETFVKSAAKLPKVQYYLIGKHHDSSIDYLKSIASKNVTFTGFVTDDELLTYLQSAKVYVQVSAHEGFGISLAEAMLCECIPVVTDKGALPEVAGESAYYVPYDDPAKTAAAVAKALKEEDGNRFRKHILNNYSLAQRSEKLKSSVEKIV